MQNRYMQQGPESEFEPGSRGRVLRNLLGIRRGREMEQAESLALYGTTQRLIDETAPDHVFTTADVRRLHRDWLGAIYPWAGEYRSVNIAKGDFMFAAATQIPALMDRFEQEQLKTLTPCRATRTDEQARSLAVVHAELILIHPFREGNGRCARVLSTLMSLQAGLPALDFSGIDGRGKRRYIAAIHAALGRDYGPMEEVFGRLLAASRESAP